MFPAESTAIPSAALVPVAFTFGSGMNARTFRSLILPMPIPRGQSVRSRAMLPDSEAVT
jgi:hypothetical protein